MTARWRYILSVLVLLAAVIWLAVLSVPSDNLSIIACDVGQGDAFLITYKSDQILIDGGPGNSVIECIDKHLPFWDRNIELVVLTHPQTDHFGGLIEVFKKYNVEVFLASGLDSSTQSFDLLKSMMGGSDARVVNATMDRDISVGLIYLDILHPSTQYILSEATPRVAESKDLVEGNERGDVGQDTLGIYTTTHDPNDFSVVFLLKFKQFDALFTGDIDTKLSDMIADELLANGTYKIEYLKVPHHGSKNGLSEKLLETVNPEIAVISAGKNNRYGHPHDEIIQLLKDQGVEILRTDEMGDVKIETDGTEFWLVE